MTSQLEEKLRSRMAAIFATEATLLAKPHSKICALCFSSAFIVVLNLVSWDLVLIT